MSFDLSLEPTENSQEISNSVYLPQCTDIQDSSSLIHITDLEVISVNGQNLRKQKAQVSYNVALAVTPLEIIEKIGQTNYVLHLPISLNARLRCYEDTELGFYNTGFMPECEGFQIGIGLGIKDSYSNFENLSIFPLPTSTHLFIQLRENINHSIVLKLYNIYGQEIMSKKWTNTQSRYVLDVLPFPKGTYFIEIKDTILKKKAMKKIIIY